MPEGRLKTPTTRPTNHDQHSTSNAPTHLSTHPHPSRHRATRARRTTNAHSPWDIHSTTRAIANITAVVKHQTHPHIPTPSGPPPPLDR